MAMPNKPFSRSFRPSLTFVTLGLLLITLWLAGGASRGDVAGQVIVRATASLALVIAILFGPRPTAVAARPVWILLGAAMMILVIQLLPLPADIWHMLPGRQIVGEVAGSDAGVWRPLSLVPGATANALAALIVPLAVLVLATSLSATEMARLPGFLLLLAVGSVLLGLLQLSGAGMDNPVVNDPPGTVSGTFANRNHFALFLAMAILLVPVWVFRDGGRIQWRGPAGLSLLLLFMLMILAGGSRAGMVVGALATFIAGVLAKRGLRRRLQRSPRWLLPAILVGVIALLVGFILVSFTADRAASIQRSFSMDVEGDMRSRALPTVLEVIRTTFPAGSGAGSFDPMFRSYEPLALLRSNYFNHAHNDLVEVVLELGLPGLLLLSAAFAWWAWASFGGWRHLMHGGTDFSQLGSAILLLAIIASVFDYPARTPLMMAIIMLAGVWLSTRADKGGTSALPASGQHL